jgi:hypothetical protein
MVRSSRPTLTTLNEIWNSRRITTELRQPPVHRLAVQPQRGSDLLGMRAGLNLLDRPQPQHLKGAVVQFPAVVLAHALILPGRTPKVSVGARSCL